jgi:site-specific recombinase XerD
MTIDGYLAYLRDVRRMSPNTVESYARDLAALAAFAEKRKLDPAALERRELEAFVRSLMASGLSPRSTARAVACIRGFYKFLAVEQRRESSPADDLRAPRAWAALPKFLDLEEVRPVRGRSDGHVHTE